MRFNSSRTNQRNDFDDFTRFLGLKGQRTQNNVSCTQNSQRSVRNSTYCNENNDVSGAKCDLGFSGKHESYSNGQSLAMVYAVKQEYRKLYDPEISLLNGTIFEELNKPFKRGSCRGSNDNGEGCF